MTQTKITNIDIVPAPHNPVVFIDKPEPCPGDLAYVSVSNTLEALKNLSMDAGLLYMEFALLEDKKLYQFSATKFCDSHGWRYDEYMDAYDELVETGYLTPVIEEENLWAFNARGGDLVVTFGLDTKKTAGDFVEEEW